MSLAREHASVGLEVSRARVEQHRLPSTGLRARDIVGLTDVWSILGMLWLLKIGSRLDLATALLGTLLIPTLYPTWRRAERFTLSALDDISAVAGRVAFVFLVASALTLVTGGVVSPALLSVAVASIPAVIGGRALSYKVVGVRRSRKQLRTLVVGGGTVAKRLIDALSSREDYGLNVIGIVDDDALLDAGSLGAPVLGKPSHLPALLDSLDIDAIVIAFSSSDAGTLDVIRPALSRGTTVWAVPRLFEFGCEAQAGDHIWGLPIVRLNCPPTMRALWSFKRTVDVVVSLLALLVAAPVMAVISALIAIESGRPILLRQERVGLGGRPFTCLKFRSMKVADPGVEATDWVADAARITKIGRWLRDTSMDELPQLFNVLRGDMSLVGPRPERPYFVDMFGQQYPRYQERHRVPVGVTGLAQVNGLRGDTSIEDRVTFDNYYIENWSLLEDMKILAKTARSLKG